MNRKQAFIIADKIVHLEARVFRGFDSKQYVKIREGVIKQLLEANNEKIL